MRGLTRFFGAVLLLVPGLLLCQIGCGGKSDSVPNASIRSEQTPAMGTPEDGLDPVRLTEAVRASESPTRSAAGFRPEVIVKTSLGDIRLKLDPEKAPRTVENFLYNYVERKFYDNTIFHFVEDGYMIAAGGYGADYQLKEARTPTLCEANNGLKNLKGTVAMARHPDYANSATCQFFINLVDNPGLDYKKQDDGEINGYCVFGKVIDGQDVVQKIAQVKVHNRDEFVNTPVQPVVIESVRRVK